MRLSFTDKNGDINNKLESRCLYNAIHNGKQHRRNSIFFSSSKSSRGLVAQGMVKLGGGKKYWIKLSRRIVSKEEESYPQSV